MYGADAEPILTPEGQLGEVLAALDHVARMLPGEHGLLTAVMDTSALASDVLLRAASGEMTVLLGLDAADRAALAALVARLRASAAGTPLGPSPTEPSEPADAAGDPGRPRGGGVMSLYGIRGDPDFRAIVEESPVPLIVVGLDGIVEYASPAVVRSLGVADPAQLEGLFLAQFLHEDDRERMGRVSELALNTIDVTTLSVRLRRIDGNAERVEVALRRLPGREGLVLALQEPGRSRDGVSELLAAERRQRALAAAADAGIALIGIGAETRGAIVDLNPGFSRLVQDSPGQLVGTPIWDLVGAEDAQRVRQAVQQVGDGGGPRHLDVTLDRPPARRASLLIGLDRSSGDPPSLASVVLRDVTEQRGAVGELQHTVERLERENGQLAEFARVTAHDLVAPLRALAGLVELLEPSVEENAQDALTAVQSAVGRMTAMVDSAAGFAGAQVRELVRSSVDLNRVVGFALETLAADIAAADAEISVGDLPFVTGDAAQLERLFVSLLANALSYSGEDAAEIEVHAMPDGAMWRISVADRGVGVEPEAREAIFRLFVRRSQAPVRAGAGRGIGLATCRQIVELHGGRIWVEPNIPRGSVFSFTLPGN